MARAVRRVQRRQLDRHDRQPPHGGLRHRRASSSARSRSTPAPTRCATPTRSTASRSPWTTTSTARLVSTPFGLYDCDVPCDGAVAVVVSHVDTVPDLRAPVVRVEAVGTAITERISWDQGTLLLEPLLQGASQHLWSRTDLKPADVDVAELYDGFTFNCLSWIEALGFCEPGEERTVRRGRQAHRARRRAAAQHPRRSAERRAAARLRLPARGLRAAARRGRRAPGAGHPEVAVVTHRRRPPRRRVAADDAPVNRNDSTSGRANDMADPTE